MKIAARFKEGLPGCELGKSYLGHYLRASTKSSFK